MFKFFRKILPTVLILLALMLPVSLATTTSTLNIGPINSNNQTATNNAAQNTNNQTNTQPNTNSSIKSVTETEVPSNGLSAGDIINIFVIAISLVLVFLSIAILLKLNGK